MSRKNEIKDAIADAIYDAANQYLHSDDAQFVLDELEWEIGPAVQRALDNQKAREKEEAEGAEQAKKPS